MEYSAILTDKPYIDYARKNNWFKGNSPKNKGIHALFGIRKEKGPRGGKSELHSIRFDPEIWSFDDAKDWVKKNNFSPIRWDTTGRKEELKEDSEAAVTTTSSGDVYSARPVSLKMKRRELNSIEMPFMKTMKSYIGKN